MSAMGFLLPPVPPDAGGGAAYDRALIAALRVGGHDVTLATAADEAGLRRAWAALAPDAIPVLDAMVLRHAEPLAAAMAGRAVAVVHHLAALSEPGQREAVRAAECRLLACLHRVVATSEAVAARLCEEYGLAAEQVRVVAPGLAELPRSAGSGGPGCAVLAVGRLAPRKGHDALLRALARLSDLPWRLDVVGDGFAVPGQAEALAGLAATLGVGERLHVHVAPDATTRERLWVGADVFALASQRETTGIAVLEALRRGLPVAVTAGGSGVPAAAGCVCEPGDEATLSKSLRRLVFDTALRADMAAAAWEAGQALPGWDVQAGTFLATIA